MDKYCVLGYPIGHSKSPLLHSEFFKLTGCSGSYTAIEMPPERLKSSIDMLQATYKGFNCTIPLKQEIIKYLSYIDPDAEMCGSVNTVKIDETGRMHGYTTDGAGLYRALAMENVRMNEKNVLIIGSGGVARASVFEACRRNCRITVAARNTVSAETIKADALKYFPQISLTVCPLGSINGYFDLAIQCTSVGMYPETDASPIENSVIKNIGFIFDTIYNPFETKLVKTAHSLGIPAAGGFNMLILQGIASQEIWRGEKISVQIVNTLIQKLKVQI